MRISIVTPSFEQGQFLERTIQSVLQQMPPPDEYIICDANSGDATPAILARYADRLRIVREPDHGQADAVNKGIRLTSGDVIGWLNSDDVYAPGALARVAAEFDAAPELDVVYGDAHLIDEHDRSIGEYYTEPWSPSRLIERCFLCQPAVFFRRRVVERFGPLQDTLHYSLDYEYWLRLAEGGAVFRYIRVVLAASRLHSEAKTLKARLAIHAEINSMLRARLGRVPESWLLNEAHTTLELRPRRPVPFAAAVVLEAIRLSLSWNGSVSRRLLRDLFAPIVTSGCVRLRRPFSLVRR